MKRYTTQCDECGWDPARTYTTRALAERAFRQHSCDREVGRRVRAARAVDFESSRQVRDCDCVQATHVHGTRVAYVVDRCRCRPCTDAVAAYERARVRQRAYGQEAFVDAAPVRAHIEALQAAGLGRRRIAALAGLPDSLISAVLYGRRDRAGGRPRAKVRPKTAAAILAVSMPGLDDLGAGVDVPATATTRRLQALVALGWSINAITARYPALNRQTLDRAITGEHPTVTAGTARLVRQVYTELEHTPPAPTTRTEVAGVTRALNRAAAAGWLVPAWWDEDTITDPDHDPVAAAATATDLIDAAAVELAIAGRRPRRLNRAERHQALAHLHRLGHSDSTIAHHPGVVTETILRDRRDLGLPGNDQTTWRTA